MADEKPKDAKPKADAKPKVEDKPKEVKPAGQQITELIVIAFVFMMLAGGVLASVTAFISGIGNQSFSAEKLISSYTKPFSGVSSPIDQTATVKNKDTDVFNEPSGKIIGKQKRQSSGKVTKGYVQISGVKYWYVDFDKGADGWVSEDGMVIVVSKPTRSVQIMLLVYKIASVIKVVLWFVIPFIIVAIAYIIYGLRKVRKNTRLKLYQVTDEAIITPKSINRSWDRILLYIESNNESEWRLAVIEADIMLAELLDTMNLMGDTIGEKLKGVEKSDFNTLDLAWEGHKIRNRIAHDPSFILTKREARRVIDLYEEVFKEFSFV